MHTTMRTPEPRRSGQRARCAHDPQPLWPL